MVKVQLVKDGFRITETYKAGIHAIPDDKGWVSILDEDGVTLALHPKENVISVQIMAGEKNGESWARSGIDSNREDSSRAK